MKKLILNIIFFMGYSSLFGQDLHSSNIQNISSNFNPALTALNYRIQGQISYRSQWHKIGSPFVANCFNVGSNLSPFNKTKNGHLSLGLNFYNEQMSKVLIFNSLSVLTSYHLKLNQKMLLSFGFNFGFFQLKVDLQKGSWESQHNGLYYDPNLNSGETFSINQQTKFDIGSGLVYTFKPSDRLNFQTGLSAYHLNNPNISLNSNYQSKFPIRYVGFLTNKYDLSNKITIKSQVLFQHQLKFNSLLFGSIVLLKFREKSKFTSPYSKKKELYAGLGLYYRSKDAFIINMSIQKNNWSFNLAYDVNISNLKIISNKRGAIELQLNFYLPYK
jgi:type IX secretion system PorP/SprF family membrane protein